MYIITKTIPLTFGYEILSNGRADNKPILVITNSIARSYSHSCSFTMRRTVGSSGVYSG